MIKQLLLTVAACLCATLFTFSQSEIIISQYIETNSGSTPKGIEIFNVSGSDITFSVSNNLQVYQGTNGVACSALAGTNITSGTLLANEVWVIGSSDLTTYTISNGTNLSGTTTYSFGFNGDDALQIYLGGVLQDEFGTCGSDPGSSWNGGGVSTSNNNLQVLDGLCDGDINGWTDPSERFTQIANGSTMTGFGNAPAACIVACTPTQTITSFAPTSGPDLTHITVTGSGFTVGSTAEINGQAATATFINATTLIVEVPSGASTGVVTIIESGCPLDSSTDFTVLELTGCSGSIPSNFNDLMISGVYDDNVESCHYIELLNPTASAINLSGYTLGFDNNFTLGSAVPTSGFSGGSVVLTGTIASGDTFMLQVSDTVGGCTTCSTITVDQSSVGSIGFNNEDRIVLLNGASALDVWQNHSNGAGFNVGYIYARNAAATAPSTAFNIADWDSNATEDCFGFSISSALPPVINAQPTDVTGCNLSLEVSVSAGNAGTLTYQWKYNDGTASGWTDVTSSSFSPGIVTGETSDSLSISGSNLDGYQFYCEIIEDGACTIQSESVQATMPNTSWDGSNWNNGIPDISTLAIFNGNYDTSVHGDFSACAIIVNATFNLLITDSNHAEVENDITISGDILVETHGSLVQNNDDGLVILDGSGITRVNKSTSVLNNWYDYTYWSSPMNNETVGSAIDIAPANNRYWFNASNYLDVLAETNNGNTFVAGHDDIDDDGNDWQIANASDIMTPGLGYAATVSPSGFVSGTYQITFEGSFNNGVITTPIAYNGANGDNDWNFIGNPYPSAIGVDDFFTANSAVVGGAIYLWSHGTPPSATNNGNETLNFSQDDYAVINGASETAGGDGVTPVRFIPSGQGFFVQGLANGNVTFNNAMRSLGNNLQFFGINNTFSEFNTNNEVPEKLWLNLSSDNGVFNQISVVYMDGATNMLDGMFYDAPRNLSSGTAAILYSRIEEDSLSKLAIQSKSPNSLDLEEVIPLGFYTAIEEATIYTFSLAQFEGTFMNENAVYIKDNLTNTVHNLKESNYNFTSETGEFNERFEIIFNQDALSLNENELSDDSLSIVEYNSGKVEFKVTKNLQIETIEIIDLLGRTIYNFKVPEGASTIYNLDALSKAAYIAKVSFTNGQQIRKKGIKRK